MSLTLREKLALVSLGYHLAVILIAGGIVALGYFVPNQPIFDSGILLFLFHALSFRRLGPDRYIQQIVIRSHTCHVCGFKLPMIGRWRCQCSFVSSERSCFSPCPR